MRQRRIKYYEDKQIIHKTIKNHPHGENFGEKRRAKSFQRERKRFFNNEQKKDCRIKIIRQSKASVFTQNKVTIKKTGKLAPPIFLLNS